LTPHPFFHPFLLFFFLPLEAALPLAIREGPVYRPRVLGAARLCQVQGPVPQDLGVGRLRVVGERVRLVRQVELSFALQRLRQRQPRGRLVGSQADRRRQVIPRGLGRTERLQDASCQLADLRRVRI